MNSQTLSLVDIPQQAEFSLQNEFEKFTSLYTHLSQEGVLLEKNSEAILSQLHAIHEILFKIGIQGNTEDFLNQLYSMNQVISDILQDGESHMWDDVQVALELFIRSNTQSCVPIIAEEVFSSVDTVLVV